MNTHRKLLADAIEKNGGYSQGYHDRWAIEYTVGLHYADLDLDHIYEVMLEKQGYQPPPTGIEWDSGDIWRWGQESMCMGLHDDDGNRSYSPDTAKRYGLPHTRFPRKYRRRDSRDACFYPAQVPGWVLVDPYPCLYFDVTFGLAGRGGKHLVVEEFEGKSLEVSAESLAYDIREGDPENYPNKWCTKLLAMMAEWDGSFTSKNASAELEHQAADQLYRQLDDKATAWRKALDEARQRRDIVRLAAVMAAPLTT